MIEVPDVDIALAERDSWERDCQAIYTRARELMSSPQLRILDSETTGLDASAEIIEVTVLDGWGTVLLDTLVKPTQPIPPKVTELHGIADADVADAQSIAQVWPQLSDVLAGSFLVCFNTAFDVRMLYQEILRYGLPWPAVADCWCAMEACRTVLSGGDPSARWPRLSVACQALGVGDAPGHRSLSDTRATLGLLIALAGRAA